MQAATEEKPISILVREMLEAHSAARSRSGVPWQKLDGMVMQARQAARRSNDTGANLNSPEDRRQKERIRREVERVTRECIRWRDMPHQDIGREAAAALAPASQPAATPQQTAQRLLNDFSQRGIRLEVASKSRLSVRPAHLLTDNDKANLKAHQEALAAAWLEQNQVWIVE
ncbi:hypothetical protein AA0242T_1983 [Acetobacter aceti NRIC 0242]|uniref:Uncharacterized protein n=1 Tax=Acetobacter aceti NBRC 14818 TaxID=887700 RepID=A0AB33IEA5_ACEAC|nr:hypothetical protein [Acetobacter aceti]GBO81281.1 hypothetical protein AA0242T_1983 [Acetobacter aceti NRIC 0242]TCS24736.1 hypothetical protein EDC15_1422 [Acetobacter aceti NBRC 14818]BCK76495.1 hypothetical protein EMQ_2101 [Acetobacter aceti NBRC 14818]BCK77371.1 hypothetical protein EMQ_2977 [Acetobacter aceti NBRC 14818]GAN58944.1 hypothetical protein Abac_135_006 [Acetobacter aceti NBRC 14818]